ncbi:MAG TPA: leucine dehydrogenase, partial [Thermoanaerobacterales bacterium]|nr:leucine dehydrogenase [Thermoanaerobacterales bacterium]
AFEKVAKIYDKILEIVDISKKQDIPTHIAADKMAEKRINNIGTIKRKFI